MSLYTRRIRLMLCMALLALYTYGCSDSDGGGTDQTTDTFADFDGRNDLGEDATDVGSDVNPQDSGGDMPDPDVPVEEGLISLAEQSLEGPFTDLLVTDLNQDGFLDITALSEGDNTATVLLLDPMKTRPPYEFQPAVQVPLVHVSNGDSRLVTGDFDGDERPDVVVYTPSSGSLDFLLNAGFGRLSEPSATFDEPIIEFDEPIIERDRSILVPGDLNGDGFDDLVFALGGELHIALLRQPSNGFEPLEISLPAAQFNGKAAAEVAFAQLASIDDSPGDDLILGLSIPDENDGLAIYSGGFAQFDEPIIEFDEPIIEFDEPIIEIDGPGVFFDEPIIERGGLQYARLGGELLALTSGNINDDAHSDVSWLLESGGQRFAGVGLYSVDQTVPAFVAETLQDADTLAIGGLMSDQLAGFGGSSHGGGGLLIGSEQGNESMALAVRDNAIQRIVMIDGAFSGRLIGGDDANGDGVMELFGITETGAISVAYQEVTTVGLDVSNLSESCAATQPLCSTGNNGICGEVRDACGSCTETAEFTSEYGSSYADLAGSESCELDTDCDGILDLPDRVWSFEDPISSFQVGVGPSGVNLVVKQTTGQVVAANLDPLTDGAMQPTPLGTFLWFDAVIDGDRVGMIGASSLQATASVITWDASSMSAPLNADTEDVYGDPDNVRLAPMNGGWGVFDLTTRNEIGVTLTAVSETGGTSSSVALPYPNNVTEIETASSGPFLYAAMNSGDAINIVTFINDMAVGVEDIYKAAVSSGSIQDVAFANDGTDFCLAWLETQGDQSRLSVRELTDGVGGLQPSSQVYRVSFGKIRAGTVDVMRVGGTCEVTWSEDTPLEDSLMISRHATLKEGALTRTDLVESGATLQGGMKVDLENNSAIQVVRVSPTDSRVLEVQTICR